MSKLGMVMVDKPVDVTSFSALYPIKRNFGKRVGHTGTLDKFASGLMLVLLSRYTKLNAAFTALDKTYIAEFLFGAETETLDPEGAIVLSAPVPKLQAVQKALMQFTGTFEQVPPRYSAVHVNGKRAYREARQGHDIAIPGRMVTVHECTLLDWQRPYLTLRIRCSKGTYIRSIARDLGRSLDSAAHVTNLRRTAVGPFSVDDAAAPDALSEDSILQGWELFRNMEGFFHVAIEPEKAIQYMQGMTPALSDADLPARDNGYLVLTSGNEKRLIGVMRYERNGSQLLLNERLYTASSASAGSGV